MAETQTTGNPPAEKPVKKTDFKVTRSGGVIIKHGKTNGVQEVVPSTLPVWLARGWEVTTPEDTAPQAYVVRVDSEKQSGTVVPVKE